MTHRPISKRLSNMLCSFFPSIGLPTFSFSSGCPGCISVARKIPKNALNIDVKIKQSKVLTAIFPLILAFKLAEPAMRLAMMRGRIISFSTLMNSSPGYDMSTRASGPRLQGRRPNPERWSSFYGLIGQKERYAYHGLPYKKQKS